MPPNHVLTQAPGLLRPLRFRHREQFIVHVDCTDALVEKAQEMGDGRTRWQRFLVAPHDVLEDPFANLSGPVRGLPLVWTACGGFRWLQQLHTDILAGYVVPNGETRFDQELGPPGV